MSEANPGFPNSGVYQLRPSIVWPPLPAQTDAEADPADADIAETLYALLPPGPAWRSPDSEAFGSNSLMGGVLRGLAGAFASLYRRLFQISRESTASTLVDSLEDWEADYALPDPCYGPDQTRQQRIRALLLKIRSAGTVTKADFIALAESVGFEITIEEPRPFTCGVSQCGGPDEVSGVNQFYWIVRVPGIAAKPFEAGVSEAGIDPLLDIARAEDLECLFRLIAPAWTRPVFNYS